MKWEKCHAATSAAHQYAYAYIWSNRLRPIYLRTCQCCVSTSSRSALHCSALKLTYHLREVAAMRRIDQR